MLAIRSLSHLVYCSFYLVSSCCLHRSHSFAIAVTCSPCTFLRSLSERRCSPCHLWARCRCECPLGPDGTIWKERCRQHHATFWYGGMAQFRHVYPRWRAWAHARSGFSCLRARTCAVSISWRTLNEGRYRQWCLKSRWMCSQGSCHRWHLIPFRRVVQILHRRESGQ